MTDKSKQSGMHNSKTDAFIQDYLSEVMGGATAPSASSSFSSQTYHAVSTKKTSVNQSVIKGQKSLTKKRVSDVQGVGKAWLVHETSHISVNAALIPTIKLVHCDTHKRSQAELVVVLLTNLYYLRRFLTPKLKRYVLILSEQVIDDYQANQWLASNSEGA